MSTQAEATTAPLALFGGTFDPVHYGHLRCAEEARQKLELASLALLPAGQPAHRAMPRASSEQRLDMLQLALKEFPNLTVDRREIDRDGPSYMVDTLTDIRQQWPERPVHLLIGQDAVNKLDSWHQWLSLFELANIVILTRPSAMVAYSQELTEEIDKRSVKSASQINSNPAGKVLPMQVAAIDISATMIKSIIRLGRVPKGMMPATVWSYIVENNLYQHTATVPNAAKIPLD